MDLHQAEVELLQLLRRHKKRVSIDTLSQDMDRIRVMRTATWLEDKQLLKTRENSRDVIELTDKGQEAINSGLPERILINRLEKGIVDVKNLSQDEKIGMSQAMKSKLVEIKNKEVLLTKTGKKFLKKKLDEEIALDNLERAKPEILKNLKNRGLIKNAEEKSFFYELTKTGQKLELSNLKSGITQLKTEHVKNWKNYSFRPYDVEAPVAKNYGGKKHPYLHFIEGVKRKLVGMGFKELKWPIVELEFWNFDALFQAQDHPARRIHDKFDVKTPNTGQFSKEMRKFVEKVKASHEHGGSTGSRGWQYSWSEQKALQLMLRSQNTAGSARAMAFEKHPKVFTIDRVFRYDSIDSKHFIEFYQLEGIVRGPKLNLRNLLGYLDMFGREVAGADDVRFRPSYFPFTEPSVEVFIHHPKLGWIEVGGAGIFRPEVTEPFGIKDNVLAWGLGLDRLAMTKLKINDIRELIFPQDLRYLRRRI